MVCQWPWLSTKPSLNFQVEGARLQETASNGYGLLFNNKNGEHLGNGSCSIPGLQKVKDTDKIMMIKL
jgi:hypothetical protein